jgi:hypothetical protein
MKLGVYLPMLTGWDLDVEDRDGGFRIRYERSHEICALCEEVRFDFIALGQHRFMPEAVGAGMTHPPASTVATSAYLGPTSRKVDECY